MYSKDWHRPLGGWVLRRLLVIKFFQPSCWVSPCLFTPHFLVKMPLWIRSRSRFRGYFELQNAFSGRELTGIRD